MMQITRQYQYDQYYSSNTTFDKSNFFGRKIFFVLFPIRFTYFRKQSIVDLFQMRKGGRI